MALHKPNQLMSEPDVIAEKFRFIGNTRYSRKSPLYRQLALGVADDPDVLALLEGADPNKQLPNLLMGAVNYLLLKGEPSRLKAYYPSFTDIPRDPADAYPAFRDFCLAHATQIRQIVRQRWVQVNEVQRCAMLVPALAYVWHRVGDQPMSLLELGTSAGLLLLWDRYHYDYGEVQLGDATAPITLSCELRGERRPPFAVGFPLVGERLGVDINPLDLNDPDDVLWLRALVWPDQPERRQRLDQAIALAHQHPIRVMQGDARCDVAYLTSHLPTDAPLIIFWSALLKVVREAAHEQIAALARHRPLYVIGLEQQTLMLYDYADARGAGTQLADVFGIGHWIEWLAD